MTFEQQIDCYLEQYPYSSRDAVFASRLLFRGAHLLEQVLNQALRPVKMDMRQYVALAAIKSADKSIIKPSDMCISLNATRVQITRLLDMLEKQGWITRQQSAQDRRSYELYLTESGHAILQQATPLAHGAYEATWRILADGEMPPLLRALTALNHSLQSTATQP